MAHHFASWSIQAQAARCGVLPTHEANRLAPARVEPGLLLRFAHAVYAERDSSLSDSSDRKVYLRCLQTMLGCPLQLALCPKPVVPIVTVVGASLLKQLIGTSSDLIVSRLATNPRVPARRVGRGGERVRRRAGNLTDQFSVFASTLWCLHSALPRLRTLRIANGRVLSLSDPDTSQEDVIAVGSIGVPLKLEQVLHKPGESVRDVYFPGGGFCSIVTCGMTAKWSRLPQQVAKECSALCRRSTATRCRRQPWCRQRRTSVTE